MDTIAIRRADSGSSTTIDSQTVSLTSGVEYDAEIDFTADGVFSLTVYDESGTQVAGVSATDTTYVTDGTFDHRGVGVRNYRNTVDVIDNWRIQE